MKTDIYPCFNWPGTIWFYSDPHFGDTELYTYRGMDNQVADEEQIRRIHSKIGKNDTLVILGDIGDVKWVKKIRGYKVLILGNHDVGASKYQRVVRNLSSPFSQEDRDFLNSFDADDVRYSYCLGTQYAEVDNHLFDEVYTGCVMLNEKIILSHEPVDFKYAFNIHGHDHSGSDFIKYALLDNDCDIPTSKMYKVYLEAIKNYGLKKLNICAEWSGYYPICLSQILKSGVLSDIPNIHRDTIDAATLRSRRKISC